MPKVFFLFLLSISFTAMGQDNLKNLDFIIQNGDTLYGDVKYVESEEQFKICEFRRASDDAYVRYYPEDISGYFDDIKGYYKAEKALIGNFRGVKVFMEVLIEGDISIYVWKEKHYLAYPAKKIFTEIKKTNDFRQQKRGRLFDKDKEYFLHLKDLFIEYGLNVEGFDRMKFTDSDMVAKLSTLFKKNNFALSYTKTIEKGVDISFALSLELSSSLLNVSSKEGKDAFINRNGITGNYVTPSIHINYLVPSFSRLIFFNTSFGYFSKDVNYSAAYEVGNFYDDQYKSDYNLSYEGITLSYGVNYSYSTEKIASIISLNLVNNIVIKSSYDAIIDYYSRETIVTNFESGQAIKSADHGIKLEILVNPLKRFQKRLFIGVSATGQFSFNNSFKSADFKTAEGIITTKLIFNF